MHGETALSLEQNGPTGNPADTTPQITALPSPVPAIRLWWCRLDTAAHVVDAHERRLSRDERARAARFGNRSLRDRYVTGRGCLRVILGGELGVDPAAVEIVRGERGRPRLAGTHSLDFNVSHTHSVALVGIAEHLRIGVDVERIDRIVNVAGIARKFLAPDERSALEALDAESTRRRVLTLWTCKEAMSKATGDALSAPFAALFVALDDDDRAIDASRHLCVARRDADDANGSPHGEKTRNRPALLRGPLPYAPDRWSLHAAPVPRDYVATIALWRRP
jgi:4'-phosphopantetheinyl transferase